ncbi:hypothetical protein LC76P1_00037 [Lysinibacillus phage LC76P1]|nr:hypothetical protein LC76P1_00037 [Lysinibacillus phage LC76P1]
MSLTRLLSEKTRNWFKEKLGVEHIRIYVNTYNGRPKFYNFFSNKLDFSFGIYKQKGEMHYAIGYIRNNTGATNENMRMIIDKLIKGELMEAISDERKS